MTSEIVRKIRSRGHWVTVIRPTTHETRIDSINRLFSLVQEHSVNLRGWDFPHIDTHNPPHRDLQWVGQEYEWEHYLESWRIYKSGQFASIVCMPDDWRDLSSLWPPDPGWDPGRRWGVIETIYQATEVFEFAARLATSEAGGDGMHVTLRAVGLAGRSLWMEEPRRMLSSRYEADVPEVPVEVTTASETLVADKRSLAARAATEIIRLFGWEPPPPVVADIQSGLERL